jgi:hypothetical protein
MPNTPGCHDDSLIDVLIAGADILVVVADFFIAVADFLAIVGDLVVAIPISL